MSYLQLACTGIYSSGIHIHHRTKNIPTDQNVCPFFTTHFNSPLSSMSRCFINHSGNFTLPTLTSFFLGGGGTLFSYFFYHCTMHFEIYIVHSPTNVLFINFVKSFKFTLKYTITLLLHASVFKDHHQGTLSLPN